MLIILRISTSKFFSTIFSSSLFWLKSCSKHCISVHKPLAMKELMTNYFLNLPLKNSQPAVVMLIIYPLSYWSFRFEYVL